MSNKKKEEQAAAVLELLYEHLKEPVITISDEEHQQMIDGGWVFVDSWSTEAKPSEPGDFERELGKLVSLLMLDEEE